MRSVAVVFPASMCAMMPMLRQRFRGTVRATPENPCGPLFAAVQSNSGRLLASPAVPDASCWPAQSPFPRSLVPSVPWSLLLPPVMRKGLVGLGHAVHVFLFLHGRATSVGRIQQLVTQLVGHALLAAAAAVRNQPADGQ